MAGPISWSPTATTPTEAPAALACSWAMATAPSSQRCSPPLLVSPPPSSVVIADFNRDGKTDLAILNQNDGLSIWLGNGDGTFQAPTAISSVTGFAPVVLDANGDGKADLALCTYSGITVLLGNGDGTFAAPVTYPANFFAGISLNV